MRTTQNVLNPISGTNLGDEVEVRVRRTSGNDKNIRWKESDLTWFIGDEYGEKEILGQRGVEVKSANFDVTSEDKDKIFIVQTSQGQKVNVSLALNFKEGGRVEFINSGEGIINFVGDSLGSEFSKNPFVSRGRVELIYHQGSWKTSTSGETGITRSEGFVEEFSVPDSSLNYTSKDTYAVNGTYIDSENALWVFVNKDNNGNNSTGNGAFIRYDFDEDQITDEITSVNGTAISGAGYLLAEYPIFERNGYIWSVSARPDEFRVVKIKTDGSTVEAFSVPQSVRDQANYNFRTVSSIDNAPRELGRFMFVTYGGSIISFDFSSESWQYDFDRFNNGDFSDTYSWNGAYIPSTQEIWIDWYDTILIYNWDSSSETVSSYDDSIFYGDQISFDVNVSGDIYYDSTNDRVAALNYTDFSGADDAIVVYINVDRSIDKVVNFRNSQNFPDEAYINAHGSEEEQGSNIINIRAFNRTTSTNGIVYYNYVSEEVVYTSFQDLVGREYSGSAPGDYSVVDTTKFYLLGRENENKVFAANNSNSGISVESHNLKELSSTFKDLKSLFVKNNTRLGGKVTDDKGGAVSFPGGIEVDGFEFSKSSDSLHIKNTQTEEFLFSQPKNGPAIFRKGLNIPQPLSVDTVGVSSFVDFDLNELNTSKINDGETIGYSLDANRDSVARVVADYDESLSDVTGNRFEVTDASFSVKSFNSSTGQYEAVFEINEAGDIVEGNIDVSNVDVTAAGTDTQVQFNDDGSFGASSNFTYDGQTLGVQKASGQTSPLLDLQDSNSSTVFAVDTTGTITSGTLSSSVGVPGSDTEILFNDSGTLGADSSVTWDGSTLATLTLTLTNNSTADTSGDLQIRDDSDGDLFSLDDGGSPQLAAKYEGNGSFTFGSRTASVVGDNSVVIGKENEASAGSSTAIGSSNTASGFGSTALGEGSTASGGASSVAMGDAVVSGGESSVAMGSQTEANAAQSISMGSGSVANGNASVAMGSNATSGGVTSVSLGKYTTAAADHSVAMGDSATASADSSTAMGNRTLSRVYGGLTQGNYNEDYVGSGNETGSISDLSTDSRIFAVGVGDNPSSISGDGDYFDGRGRVDGLYVTMRDGTFIRHGLQVDRWTGSAYERTLRINKTITEGSSGEQILVRNPNTNELEYISSDNIVAEGVNVEGGNNITTTYNSSTDAFTVNASPAGSAGEIQFRGPDGTFDGSSNFEYVESTNTLTVRGTDGTITNDVPGLFGGFLDPVTKLLFPFEEFTEKADIPTVSGFPSLTTIQGGFTINQSTDETLTFGGGSGFFYPHTSDITIKPNNSQGYVDFDTQSLSISPFINFAAFRDVKAEDFSFFGYSNVVEVFGNETVLRESDGVAPLQGSFDAFFLNGGGTIQGGTAMSGAFDIKNFTGTIEERVIGCNVQLLGDPTQANINKAYGFNQESPFMDNFFEGTVTRSSGSLVSDEDNFARDYHVNQRTDGSGREFLFIDSQGYSKKPSIPDDGTWHFEVKVIARVTDVNASLSGSVRGDTHVWRVEGVVTSTITNASTGAKDVRFVGNPSVVTVANDNSTQNYTLQVGITSSGELELEVEGKSGDTVNWTGDLSVGEVSG